MSGSRPHCISDKQLDKLADQELTDRAAIRKLHDHLLTCDRCRARFRKLTATRYPVIRNYTILEQVGRGGFGNVYRAIHHGKQRFEAIKVCSSEKPRREAFFANEVHLIAALRHPNIATLYEAQLSTAPSYYTMEFVDGRPLDEFVRAERPNLRRQLTLFRKIVAAIGYAHRQGVVHRDIKPLNILIDHESEPRIVDFGIAKRLKLRQEESDSGTRREGPLGTIGYISPEQLAGDQVDARADIFALGAMLFHWITGEPAKFAIRNDRVLRILRTRRIDRAQDLAAIIQHCIEPDPDERYPDCEALLRDLDAYLAGGVVQARRSRSMLYRTGRIGAYLVQNRPLLTRVTITATTAVACLLAFQVGSARFVPVGDEHGANVRLITFDAATLRALQAGAFNEISPAIQPTDRYSWRLLHAALMRRLSDARPRMIAWDFYFSKCAAQYDPTFAAALEACPVPVVVGSSRFDVNSEPQICEKIRGVIDGYGSLVGVAPVEDSVEVGYALALKQPGFEPMVPTLATAAFTAVRRPDSEAVLRPQLRGIEVRYRRRNPPVDALRWHLDTDTIPVVCYLPVEKDPLLNPDTAHPLTTVPRAVAEVVRAACVSYRDVLEASDAQLRDWFEERAVVIGMTIPPSDYYPDADLFGVEIQAAALDRLLSGALPIPLGRYTLAGRVALWAALIAALSVVMPLRLNIPVRRLSSVLVPVALLAPFVGGYFLLCFSDRAIIETVIAVAVACCTGSLLVFTDQLRARQLQLSPLPTWSTNDTTMSSTLVVEAATSQPSV